MSTNLTITTEQLFSRRHVSHLWNIRSELDKGQVAHLDALWKQKVSKSIQCKQKITYKLSKSKAGSLGYGRLYATTKGSLEVLEREIRGTICKDYYYDIDIVNCHPVLLSQICQRDIQKDTPELDNYCANRDSYFGLLDESQREIAKTDVLKALYGGKVENLVSLAQEIKQVTKLLSREDKYQELASACKGQDNFYGSFLSYLVQTEERKIMLVMKDALESFGWSVDVLAYDGVMIRKDPALTYTDDLLRNLETIIFEKTGFKITLKNKEFSYYDVPVPEEEIFPGVSKNAYLELKQKFELNHFYHTPTNTYCEVIDDQISYFTLEHAKEVFRSKYYFKLSDKFGDIVLFFDLWRKDETRKEITTIDFTTSENLTHYTLPLNFRASTFQPVSDPTSYLSLFHTLLKNNCNKDLILEEYLLKYLAHLVQKPLEAPRIALMITGRQGTGKDTLFEFMGQWVVGQSYYKDYNSNEQFFDKHDTGKLNKFLIKLQEADPTFCRKKASDIKALITSPTVEGNPKGLKTITASNYGRYILTTNKGNPLELEQDDRRWVVLNSSSDYKGNTDFWNTVYKTLFTKEGGRAVWDYLQTVDISNYNPTTPVKNTYKEDVVETEKGAEQLYIESWDGSEVSAPDLYENYRQYCIQNNLRYAPTSLSFGKRLLPFLRDGVIKKRKTNTNYLYSK